VAHRLRRGGVGTTRRRRRRSRAQWPRQWRWRSTTRPRRQRRHPQRRAVALHNTRPARRRQESQDQRLNESGGAPSARHQTQSGPMRRHVARCSQCCSASSRPCSRTRRTRRSATRYVIWRPARSASTKRHHRRHARWFETLLCRTPSASTSSETVRGRSRSSSRTARRVGSPRTRKKRADAVPRSGSSDAAMSVTRGAYNRKTR